MKFQGSTALPREAATSITNQHCERAHDHPNKAPSESAIARARKAWLDKQDEANRSARVGDRLAEMRGVRDQVHDAETAALQAGANQLRHRSGRLEARRQAVVQRAQEAADAGKPVGRFMKELSPFRGVSRSRVDSSTGRSRTACVSVAATRRTRTCGGGRPAARASRTATGGGGGSGDSDPSSSPRPRAAARRIGGEA